MALSRTQPEWFDEITKEPFPKNEDDKQAEEHEETLAEKEAREYADKIADQEQKYGEPMYDTGW